MKDIGKEVYELNNIGKNIRFLQKEFERKHRHIINMMDEEDATSGDPIKDLILRQRALHMITDPSINPEDIYEELQKQVNASIGKPLVVAVSSSSMSATELCGIINGEIEFKGTSAITPVRDAYRSGPCTRFGLKRYGSEIEINGSNLANLQSVCTGEEEGKKAYSMIYSGWGWKMTKVCIGAAFDAYYSNVKEGHPYHKVLELLRK